MKKTVRTIELSWEETRSVSIIRQRLVEPADVPLSESESKVVDEGGGSEVSTEDGVDRDRDGCSRQTENGNE